MQTEANTRAANVSMITKNNVIIDKRIISTFTLNLTQRLLDEDNGHHLVVYADRVVLRENLYFPAKDIYLHARVITLEDNCAISTHVSEDDLKKKSFAWSSPKLEALPDFFEEPFKKEKKKAADLRSEIKKWLGSASSGLDKIKNDIDWLNRCLQLTDMYKVAERKLQNASATLKQLAADTAFLRNKTYADLGADEQKSIQKLNREIIDTLHPLETTQLINAWLDFGPSDSALQGEGYEELSKGDGGTGYPGYDGRNGSNGIDGGNIVILAEQIELNNYNLSLDTRGTRGARAESGGKGGYGGKAGESKAKVDLLLNYWITELKIDDKNRGVVSGGWGVRISRSGADIIKSVMNKAGKGGDGGKAGRSGDGGKGGTVFLGYVHDSGVKNITTTTTGGAAGPGAEGGTGGDGGVEPVIKMKVWNNNTYNVEDFKGDRGLGGEKGKGNMAANAGADGAISVQKIGYDAFMRGFDNSPGLSDQRIITFRSLKAYYLKGGSYADSAANLITWLLKVTPKYAYILEHEKTLLPAQRQELTLMAALRSNVEVLQGYRSAGLDFYGRSPNYTPVFSFDHYKSRINDMLRTGKLVEDEYRSWAQEKRQREDMAADLNKTMGRINAGTDKIINGFSQLLDERKEIEQQLDTYRRQLDTEGSAIWEKQRAFMEAIDSKLKITFGLGCLNILAQLVLISTGNVAYGKYLKLAGNAIEKIKDMKGLDNQFTDPIKQSFENSSAALEALDKSKREKKEKGKEKKEVEAKIIDDGDKQRIEIEINKVNQPKDDSKPGGFKELYSKGVDVVQHVLPIFDTAAELWEIGKKFGEVQNELGFDAVKLAMDEGSYDDMIDKFAGYADAEAKAFKENIAKYMELVKNRNELLLNYRALQGKCAELYAKNALLNVQLSICRERMAWAEDPAVAGMDQFWASMYDFMRDRILDRIYDEYKTYRFYSVTDQPFSETAISNILRGHNSRKPFNDIGDEIELSPNITSLSILQEIVAEKMFAAEEGQFGSWKAFKNEAGRVSFKRTKNASAFIALEKTGKAAFYVSPELPVFKKLAYVSLNSVEAFFVRKPSETDIAPVRVSLLLQHEGFVEIKDINGLVIDFSHNKPNPFAYEYCSFFDVPGTGKKPKFNSVDARLSDRADNEVFYELSGNHTITDNKYIRINPCTRWTIEIDADNTTGLNMEEVTELIIQFNGKGIVINSLKNDPIKTSVAENVDK